MRRNELIFVICTFALSIGGLVVLHLAPSLADVGVPIASGSDAALWQVQTTLLAVGFAGLAIAAQLFAEAPTAVGASRNRVLVQIRAGWFVAVGLAANLIIGTQAIWLPSPLGALIVAASWFLVTVVLLINSSVRLVALFGNPSRLDELIRSSIVDNLALRLDSAARSQADAQRRLGLLVALGVRLRDLTVESYVLKVPMPRGGLVVKGVRRPSLRSALALLAPKVVPETEDPKPTGFLLAQISVDVAIGDRARLGQTAFRVGSEQPLPEDLQRRVAHLLQSSLEFEPADSVTLDEVTNREIADLQDTVGVSIRSGAFETAERAIELLAAAVRGVWTARTTEGETPTQVAARRPDWLFRSIWEVERDALLSPRAADMFVSRAMSRAIEAPATNSLEYVEECLRSFEHLWYELLRSRDQAFEHIFDRICTCLQNLAEFSFPFDHQRSELQARAAWTFVAIVKQSMDAGRHDAALRAARELAGLFEFGDHKKAGRSHVRAGQLVLSGWVEYLDAKTPKNAPRSGRLRQELFPTGTMKEILAARSVADAMSRYARWDWWDMRRGSSRQAGVLQMSHFVDRAELVALSRARGPLPDANDQATASKYERLLRLLPQVQVLQGDQSERISTALATKVEQWRQAQQSLLVQEPISSERVSKIRDSLRAAFREDKRLAELIPNMKKISSAAARDRPILGMNLRVPRDFLVDRVFNNTYSDPSDLGRMIARGFQDAEDARIVELLKGLPSTQGPASEARVVAAIRGLRGQAKHYVLLTPLGGLLDIDEWRSSDLAEALNLVTRIETSALDTEAILFDPRHSIRSVRRPEEKPGLDPVEPTMIAVGVFEDVQGKQEPEVRVEAGEYFVLWPGRQPRVEIFADGSDSHRD